MDLKKQVESLLFSSGKVMGIADLAELTQSKEADVRKAIDELKAEYDSRDTSLMLEQQGEGWKLNVKEKYVSLVTKIVADTELPFPVLETLSIVAYKAPAMQADVIKARGTNAYEHIQTLIDAGFVERRKQGRSFLIGLTPKFFEYFDVPGEHGLKQLLKDVQPSEPKKRRKLGALDVVDIEEPKPEEPKPSEPAPAPEAAPVVEPQKPDPFKEDDDFLRKLDEQIDQISKRNDAHSEDDDLKRKQDTGQEAEDLNNEQRQTQ